MTITATTRAALRDFFEGCIPASEAAIVLDIPEDVAEAVYAEFEENL